MAIPQVCSLYYMHSCAIACVYIVGSMLCVLIGLEKSVLREMASKASNSLTSISDVL